MGSRAALAGLTGAEEWERPVTGDPHEQMQEQPRKKPQPPWEIPVLTRQGEATRYIVITDEDGHEVWTTPKYPFVFPRDSKAALLAAVVESDAYFYGDDPS